MTDWSVNIKIAE